MAFRMYTAFEFKELYSCLDEIESMNCCNLTPIFSLRWRKYHMV